MRHSNKDWRVPLPLFRNDPGPAERVWGCSAMSKHSCWRQVLYSRTTTWLSWEPLQDVFPTQSIEWVWSGKRKHLPQGVKKSWEIRINDAKLEKLCKVITAQEHSYVGHQWVYLVWISEALRGLRFWNSLSAGPSRNATFFKISTVDLWTQLVHYHSKGMSSGQRVSWRPEGASFQWKYYGQKPSG